MTPPELGAPIRRCPECGEEFQPHVVSCSDCGAQLVSAFENDSAAVPNAPEEVSPADPEYVTLASQLTAEMAEQAAQALAAEGVRFRLAIDLGYSFRLVVEPDDVTQALAVLAREGLAPGQPDPEQPAVAEAGGPCPACDHRVAPGTSECPGCGLLLADPVECRHCGAALEPTRSDCPRCGREQD